MLAAAAVEGRSAVRRTTSDVRLAGGRQAARKLLAGDAQASLDRLDREEDRTLRRAAWEAEGNLGRCELARRVDPEAGRPGRLAFPGREVAHVDDLENGMRRRAGQKGEVVRGVC